MKPFLAAALTAVAAPVALHLVWHHQWMTAPAALAVYAAACVPIRHAQVNQ